MSIPPSDARVLARLMAVDAPLNGALAAMSAEWRPLADLLAAAPFPDRGRIFDDFLTGRPDRDAIIRAIADQDPTGPPVAVEAPPGPTVARDPQTTARLIRAADIEAKPIDWLWRGRVPLGMLTTLAGDPKLGKSFVTLGMAAAVSRGSPLPDGDPPGGPGSVIIMSAEDDPARTIAPRLKAAGADLARVHILESVMFADGSEAWPSLGRDIEAIERAARDLGDCRLIVIDPVSAYLGGADDHRNAELRSVLSPLKALAESLDAAIMLVTHLSKSGGTNGKHRVIGSVAYVGACRANFLFVKDRDDPTGRRVLMLDNGGNLAPPAPTLAYAIEDRGAGPQIEWGAEPVQISAEEALAAEMAASQAVRDHQDAPERQEAESWLREVLAAGPVPSKEIEAAAKAAGLSVRTLKRAKESIGAESIREGFGRESTCRWRLADARND